MSSRAHFPLIIEVPILGCLYFWFKRTTTYKIESPTKITVDNPDSVRYNEDKKSTPTITLSTDFAKQWEENNQGALKYAGDSAKRVFTQA